MLNVETRVFTM